MIIGFPQEKGVGTGVSYLVFGKAEGLANLILESLSVGGGVNGFAINGEKALDLSGFSVASAGDVNGDGFDDVIVGALYGDGPADSRGSAGDSYVVFGKEGGFAATLNLADIATGDGSQGFVLWGETAGDQSGLSVSSAGDVNADGFDDVIVGARFGDGPANGRSNAGDSYVVFGKEGGFAPAFDLAAITSGDGSLGFVLHGEKSNDWSGGSVASAGDVNGDGVDDLIVGAEQVEGPVGEGFAGAAYVVFGKAGASDAVLDLADIAAGDGSKGFILYGSQRLKEVGVSVASAGDINGDGFDDLVVGAPSGPGDTFVIFGSATIGGSTSHLTQPVGGDTSDTLTGTAGAADVLVGGRGDDTLSGGGGVDSLRGGEGDDTLSISDASFLRLDGGNGSDTLLLAGAVTLVDSNFRRVSDMEGIALSAQAVDLTLGRNASQAFSGVASTGFRLDTTASTSTAAQIISAAAFNHSLVVDFSKNAVGVSLGGGLRADQLTGGSGNDTLNGGGGQDTLNGGGGGDILNGGEGADFMSGGGGNDTYYVNTDDVVTEAAGGGDDRIAVQSDFALGSGQEIELITTTNYGAVRNIDLRGNERAQSIVGNEGNNWLHDGGFGGTDTLVGRGGNDYYTVYNADAVIIEGKGEGDFDRLAAGVDFVLARGVEIESIRTTNQHATYAIDLTGNEFGQQITGNDGDSWIDGKGGSDSLEGALGNDTLHGGTGDDTLYGGYGGRLLPPVGVHGSGSVTRPFGTPPTPPTDVSNAFNLAVNPNIIDPTSTPHVTINATGDGNPHLYKLDLTAGATLTLDIDATTGGLDTRIILLHANLEEIARNDDSGTTDGAGGSTSILDSFLTFTVNTGGSYLVVVTGTDINADTNRPPQAGQDYQLHISAAGTPLVETSDDTLYGDSGADTLWGGGGNDLLDGGADADTMDGGTGDDRFIVDNAADVVMEGAGEGTADRVSARVSHTLQAGAEIELLTTTSSAGTTVIDLTGNELDQSIIGNAAANKLNGGGGQDRLYGGAGNDTLDGDFGAGPPTPYPVGVRGSGSVTRPFGTDPSVPMDVSNAFNLAANPNIIDPTSTPHVTINATGDGHAHLYRLDLTAGATLTLDIDATTGGLDSRITLLHENFDEIAQNNNSDPTNGAGGSVGSVDSFLTFTVNTGGTYLIVVTGADISSANRPPQIGQDYQLHISAAAVPTGESSNDVLNGGSGNDTMDGGIGNDMLDGGAGVDTMDGGTGDDRFIVDNAADVVMEGAGEGTADRVSTRVSYTLQAGVEIELLTTTSFAGTTVVDLTGNEFAQSITGNAAANTLDGRGGNDVLNGGGGNDLYYVTTGDVVTEAMGGGDDRVAVQSNFALGSGQEIELLTTTDSTAVRSIDISGNEFAQTIFGNNGNNSLNDGGVGGADTLVGRDGNDTYTVHNSSAVIIEGKGQGDFDRVAAGVDFVLAQGVEIESLSTTDQYAMDRIDLNGNEFDQQITGNDGDSWIDGKAGNDILEGALGNDTLHGGTGNDTLYGDSGERRFLFPVGVGGSGSITRPTSVDPTTLDVSNAFNLAANPNIIDPTSTPHVTITATGDGNPHLYKLDLTAGATLTLDIDATTGGLDTRITLLRANLEEIARNDNSGTTDGAAGSTSNLDSFLTSTVTTGGSYLIFVTGPLRPAQAGQDYQLHISATGIPVVETSNDNLYGDSGVDTLWGGGGNDLLDGGADADTMSGGTGDDRFIVDNAADVVVEGAGEGTADRVLASVSYTLKAGAEIELLTTTSSADATVVNLTGNEVAQSITGNAGANILDGKDGSDTLTGLGGNDFFVFSTALGAANIDAVTDFNVADDTIRLENAVFTALTTTGVLSASLFKDNFLAPRDADDRILYNSNTGSLFYDADGTGTNFAAVKFASLAAGLSLTAADFVVI